MGQNVTGVGCAVDSGKKELKKHAATIHCSNTLSLLQRKITNALLYHAYKELMLKEEHEITIKQLCRLIGYQGNNHAAIKDALRGLISTIIEWNVVNDETGLENWTASTIIASVSLEGPICYYAYSPRMKQLLHSPSMFGKIDLVIQAKFRSSYGLALYENCIRYRGLPHTKWFDMVLFKKLMGVPDGKYDIFRDFKRRVLDKAIDEVNTYSDLIIAAEFIREGRKVVRMRFKLKERAKKMRLGSSKAAFNKPQLEETRYDEVKIRLLNEFHLAEEQVEALLTEHELGYVESKMTLILQSKAFQDKKIQNMSAYLLSALKFDYQDVKGKIEGHSIVNLQEATLGLDKIKKQVTEIRDAYMGYREKMIEATIGELEMDARAAFMAAFLDYAAPTINMILHLQRKKYCRDNVMESPQMKALLRRYALRELPLLTLKSPEEFVAKLSDEQREAWQKLKSYDPDNVLLSFNE